ncbi:hypothetical protein KR038_001552 [Drosophila bunnanda]|nr:hypothetical protein KR038_001552 [Drosophila bunnanda]
MNSLLGCLLPMLILLLLGSEPVEFKQYGRCELTRVLVEKYKFDKTFISNCKLKYLIKVNPILIRVLLLSGICLVEHESNLSTTKITKTNNESKNYGLFQINSRDYCAEGRKGGRCNSKCEDFSNDEIGDDIACAKMIQEREGFKYWKGWSRICRNPQNLPNLGVACNLRNLRSLSPLRTPRFPNPL